MHQGRLGLLAPHNGTGTNANATLGDITFPLAIQPDHSFEVDMRLHKDLVQSTMPFDLGLGLPGIPFSVTTKGNVTAKVGFDYELCPRGRS